MAVDNIGDKEYVDLNLYEDDVAMIDNPLHLFLQEVELAVKIAPFSIWGCKDSISLQKYVFNQYVTVNQIRQEITSYIQNNCANSSQFNYTIEVEVLDVDSKSLLCIILNVEVEDQLTGGVKKYVQKFAIG